MSRMVGFLGRLLACVALLLAPLIVAADWEAGLQAYRNGDYPSAIKEFEKAAEAGDRRAFGKLGGMYLYGRGVPKDYVQAYAWFNLAETAGDRAASAFRDAIAGMLDSQQIYEAERLYAQYLDRYLPQPPEE